MMTSCTAPIKQFEGHRPAKTLSVRTRHTTRSGASERCRVPSPAKEVPLSGRAPEGLASAPHVKGGPFVPGGWHRGERSLLQAALAEISERGPALNALAGFLLPRLPGALLCSDTLKTATPWSAYRRMNEAVRHKWMGMQAREQAWINVLMVDCDKEGWRERLQALIMRGLPPPAFMVVSPVRLTVDERDGTLTSSRSHETAHAYWVLKCPVKKTSPKAYDLFRRVRDAIVVELDADPAAAGHLGKNPFHQDFRTEVGALEPVELRDLYGPMFEWCEEGAHWLGRRTIDLAGRPAYDPARIGRATTPPADGEAARWGRSFEARHGIYRSKVRDYETILAMVEEHAAAVGSPANSRALRTTAASIHRFMLNKAFCKGSRPGIDHGAMTREAVEAQSLDWAKLTKPEKRCLAGRRSRRKESSKDQRTRSRSRCCGPSAPERS